MRERSLRKACPHPDPLPRSGRGRESLGLGEADAALGGGAAGGEVLLGGGLEGVGLVGLLPGELGLLAAEVTVGGGLLIDGAQEVELAHEGAGAAVEVG